MADTERFVPKACLDGVELREPRVDILERHRRRAGIDQVADERDTRPLDRHKHRRLGLAGTKDVDCEGVLADFQPIAGLWRHGVRHGGIEGLLRREGVAVAFVPCRDRAAPVIADRAERRGVSVGSRVGKGLQPDRQPAIVIGMGMADDDCGNRLERRSPQMSERALCSRRQTLSALMSRFRCVRPAVGRGRSADGQGWTISGR